MESEEVNNMIAPSPAPDKLKVKEETETKGEVKEVKVLQTVVDEFLVEGDKLVNDKVITTQNTEYDSVVATEERVVNPEPSQHETALKHQGQEQVRTVQHEPRQGQQEQVQQEKVLNQPTQEQVQVQMHTQEQKQQEKELNQQVQMQVQKPDQVVNQQEQVQAMERGQVLAQDQKQEKLPEPKQGEVRNELGVIRVYGDSKSGQGSELGKQPDVIAEKGRLEPGAAVVGNASNGIPGVPVCVATPAEGQILPDAVKPSSVDTSKIIPKRKEKPQVKFLPPKVKVKRRRQCRFPGCLKTIKSQGHCQKHGARAKRCKIPGCEKQAQGTHQGMCKRHWKEEHDPKPPPEPEEQPPDPVGQSVYDSIIPSSIAWKATKRRVDEKEVMPLVTHLRQSALLPAGWHRNQERASRGVKAIPSTSAQFEVWERQLVLLEIALISGTMWNSHKDLAHAWGREKGFHNVLVSQICERRGEMERKRRSDVGKLFSPEQKRSFRSKLHKSRAEKRAKELPKIDSKLDEPEDFSHVLPQVMQQMNQMNEMNQNLTAAAALPPFPQTHMPVTDTPMTNIPDNTSAVAQAAGEGAMSTTLVDAAAMMEEIKTIPNTNIAVATGKTPDIMNQVDPMTMMHSVQVDGAVPTLENMGQETYVQGVVAVTGPENGTVEEVAENGDVNIVPA